MLSYSKETRVSSSSVVREPGCLFYCVLTVVWAAYLCIAFHFGTIGGRVNSPNRSLLYPSSSCCSLFFTIPRILFIM
jgi:hypothetical protein